MQGQTLLFEVIHASSIATDAFARQKHQRPFAKSAASSITLQMEMTAQTATAWLPTLTGESTTRLEALFDQIIPVKNLDLGEMCGTFLPCRSTLQHHQ